VARKSFSFGFGLWKHEQRRKDKSRYFYLSQKICSDMRNQSLKQLISKTVRNQASAKLFNLKN
jgi:hypothetical protein